MTASTSKTRQHRLLIPWCVVLLGFISSVFIFAGLRKSEEAGIDTEFRRRAQNCTNHLEEIIASQIDALRTLRDLFHYSDDFSRSEFALAAADLLENHPGLNALFWAPRVPAATRDKFVADVRANGTVDFEIRSFAPTNPSPPNNSANDSFPILIVAPFGYLQIEGLDLATSPIWPDFAEAGESAAARASGQAKFILRDAADSGYLIELPVYRDSVPRTEQERRTNLRGFVLAVINPPALLETLMTLTPDTGLDILLIERLSPASARTLHYLPAEKTANAPPPTDLFLHDQNFVSAVNFAGKTWEMRYRPSPAWLASQRTHHAHITAFFSLLLSALGALYLRFLFRQTAAVEATVAKRTAELTETQRKLNEDIQRRAKIEQALQASEERHRILINQSIDAIGRLELPNPLPLSLGEDEQVARILATGRLAECNNATAITYGYKQASDLVGKPIAGFTTGTRARYEAVLHVFVRNGHHLTEHEAWDNTAGSAPRVFVHNLYGVIENNCLTGIWVTERELTQQRQIEQEMQNSERRLAKAQHLESLSVLAGGIAHDFNNLLTGILGNASLGRAEIAPDSPLHGLFADIENASRRAASLCQQMLAYAGKGRFVVKPHDLSRIVSDTTRLLQVSVEKNTELRLQLAENLPLVLADATQLQQIITNLVINATEAIGQHHGFIHLATGLVQPEASTFSGCVHVPEKIAGSYVFLSVRDNGPGINADQFGRIFEPFYTTKFSGRGLGLPATLGIIRSHNGALRVESQSGAGTKFTIYLPVAELSVTTNTSTVSSNSPWRPEGGLLIIDDEEPVRSIAERMARTLGFSAMSACDGPRGIELFRLHQESIACVLIDLSMPGLTGEETLQCLREIAPEADVVIMSGFDQSSFQGPCAGKPPVFLPKPFNIAQLQRAVKQALTHS